MKVRDIRIDYARATAVLMMILQHVCIFLHEQNITVTYVSATIVEIIMLITKSAVPLFIIITGSVLLNEEKDFSVKKGIKHSLGMIEIIIVWNVINAIYFYFNDGLKIGFEKLLYGNYWYLYMLVGLYLLMPIVNVMVKDYCKTKIPIYVILLTLVYEWWLSYALVMPDTIYGYVAKLVNKLHLSLVTGNVGLLLLGFMLRNENINIKLDNIKKKILVFMNIILIIFLLAYSIFAAVKNNEYNYIYFDEYTACIIGGFLFYVFQKLKVSGKYEARCVASFFRRKFLFIGTHSLGMYVISNIFLDIYKRLPISIEAFPNTIIGIIVCWIMMIIPTYAVVWLMEKTLLKKII